MGYAVTDVDRTGLDGRGEERRDWSPLGDSGEGEGVVPAIDDLRGGPGHRGFHMTRAYKTAVGQETPCDVHP